MYFFIAQGYIKVGSVCEGSHVVRWTVTSPYFVMEKSFAGIAVMIPGLTICAIIGREIHSI